MGLKITVLLRLMIVPGKFAMLESSSITVFSVTVSGFIGLVNCAVNTIFSGALVDSHTGFEVLTVLAGTSVYCGAAGMGETADGGGAIVIGGWAIFLGVGTGVGVGVGGGGG